MAKDRGGAPPSMVYADVQVRYPYETAEDVVTYADLVVLVRAVRETELADKARPAGATAGEGAIYRQVAFRVERTLWSRAGVPTPPAEVTAVWWGWVLRDHQRVPLVGRGAPWVRMGTRYVLPLVYETSLNTDRFEPTQLFASFPLDGERVAPEAGQDTALARRLRGETPDGVAAVFTAAKPDAS